MREEKLRTVRSDVQVLLQEAQELFTEAAATTGKKAEDLRAKGEEILDRAFVKAQGIQSYVVQTGKEIASTTDDYVQSNPWRAIAISTGVGLLLGLCVARTGER
ncbi:DUF883 family protein [Herbaspirillum lusitanum]|uniref:DUF883 family protein n=1 Tax=Herbaspirillum lusitanum TaxID=213312 RepID=UPI00030E762F|nr:DUF883 family protein [Herbaspirillum lusitanum]MCW5300758.1 DUF883 family protein [Herbaspirillum lusitanum]